MTRSRRVSVVLLVAALVVSAAAFALPGMGTGLVFLLPALVLLGLLLSGRYVGEDGLQRLVCAVRGDGRRRTLAPSRPLLPRRPRALMPRGGSLVATSLAVRPPPLVGTSR